MQDNTIRSPLQATVVQWLVQPGAAMRAGDVVVILEAMKMEHEVRALADGRVAALQFAVGELVNEGDLLLVTELLTHTVLGLQAEMTSFQLQNPPLTASEAPASAPRPDLQRVIDRHAFTLDAARVEAVAKRHALGRRTARENIADLCDEGSFMEHGALAVAAQRSRRSEEDLIVNTPAAGLLDVHIAQITGRHPHFILNSEAFDSK